MILDNGSTHRQSDSHPIILCCVKGFEEPVRSLRFKTYSHVFHANAHTIPIVAFTADPVALGLVASLARPGGNITGVINDAGVEIWGKRLDA